MNLILFVSSWVYIAILLTISFFVLFAVDKTENRKLEKFGKAVAGLLWVAVFLIVAIGFYITIKTPLSMRPMMRQGAPMQQP